MATIEAGTDEKTGISLKDFETEERKPQIPTVPVIDEKTGISLEGFDLTPDVSTESVKELFERELAEGKVPKLENVPRQFFFERFNFTELFREDPEKLRAKSQNALAFSEMFNISPSQAFDLHDQISEELGLRQEIQTDEFLGGATLPIITAGLATNPAATIIGLAVFEAMGEGESAVINLVKGEKYQAFQKKGLKELLPEETSDLTKDVVEILDFVGKGLVAHGMFKRSPRLIEGFTKQIIEEYKAPRKLFIDPADLRAELQTGGVLPAEEAAIIGELTGLGKIKGESAIKVALRKGVSIEIPAERISVIRDRPWFARVKQLLKIDPAQDIRRVEVVDEKIFKFGEKEVKAKTPETIKLLTDAGGKIVEKKLVEKPVKESQQIRDIEKLVSEKETLEQIKDQESIRRIAEIDKEIKEITKEVPKKPTEIPPEEITVKEPLKKVEIKAPPIEKPVKKKPATEKTLIRQDIQELYADAIEIADAKGDRVEVKRLQEELKLIGGTITTPAEMRKLRQTIHAFASFKGLSKKQLTSLTKGVTGHLKTTHKDITADQLKQILAKVKTARPKTVGHKTVITRQTEKRIQTLKETLIERNELTDEAFNSIMESMRISKPKYIDSNNFITETQGKDLIDRMLKTVPLIKDQIKVDNALKENPVIKGSIDRITNEFKKQQGDTLANLGGVRQLLDMHHFVDSMEKQTGVSFGRTWEHINDKRRELDLKIDAQIDRVQKAGGDEFKNIADNEDALIRINDYIASKLPDYVKGKPTVPSNITKAEKSVADEIVAGLKGFEADVRYNRFYQWREKGVKIPNAPQGELARATEILETQGDKALRKWLSGRDWGVIRSGYDIGEVIKPTVKADQRRVGFGSQHLSPRESVIFQRYERDILQRYGSYVRQMTYRTELKTDIDAWVKLFELNKDKIENPSQTADLLTRNITELLNQRQLPAILEELVLRIYSQAARTIFLDVRKGARNLFQNVAFYSGVEDMFTLGNMSPADIKYFETHVSQNKGIQKDWLYQQYRGLPGLGSLNKIADEINVMGRTDTINRMLAFRAKLGNVRRALKDNAGYKTDSNAMADLQRDVGFSDIEPMERVHALKTLAIDGENTFARYVARAITQKVHFLYERIQRSPAEQGNELSRILSNLLTFRKGYAQRLILDVRKLAKSQKDIENEIEGGRGRTFGRSIIGMFVLSAIASYVYQQVTGDDREPYGPHQILGDLSLGGLATGAQQQVGDFTRNAILAVTGDKDALSKTVTNITRSADMFIPFYDEVINAVEGMTGYQNVDKAVLRQMREAIDNRINSKPLGFYKKERNLIESGQHVIFGTDKEIKKSIRTVKK